MRNHVWKLAGLVIAIAVALWLIKAPIISSYLSKTLGMHVSISTIGIGSSQMNMRYFKIVNPRKYVEQYALTADSIRFGYQWKELRDTPAIIDRIEIDGIKLAIEFANPLGTQNNWTDLIAKMPPKKEHAKEVIVKKLVLKNLTVNIRGMGLLGKNETKTIDQMEFNDVSSNEGFPMKELITRIFGEANILDYIKNIIPGGPGGIIKKVVPFFGTSLNESNTNPSK